MAQSVTRLTPSPEQDCLGLAAAPSQVVELARM